MIKKIMLVVVLLNALSLNGCVSMQNLNRTNMPVVYADLTKPLSKQFYFSPDEISCSQK